MSIFTKLSLFFFIAFIITASLSVFSDQFSPDQTMLLSQIFVSACMLFYIMDQLLQSRRRNLQATNEQHERQAGEARLQASEARLEALQRDLKARDERIAALERKMKSHDEDAAKGDQAVVQFLRNLQSKGRLIDFAMTDIHRIPDPQVGAVARIVHQGVRELLQDYFQIAPLAQEAEGSVVAVKNGGLDSAYHILQNGGEDKPAQGRLVHRGWQALSRRLPRSIQKESEDNLRVLAPAEIDARTDYT